MTREQLIGLGMTPQLAQATAVYLKNIIPRPPRFADPTALVNNEGAMNGWINAADAINALSAPVPDPNQPELPMYSEPRK